MQASAVVPLRASRLPGNNHPLTHCSEKARKACTRLPSAHQPVSHTVASVEMAPASAGGEGHSSAAALYQAAPHRPTVAPISGNHITAKQCGSTVRHWNVFEMDAHFG